MNHKRYQSDIVFARAGLMGIPKEADNRSVYCELKGGKQAGFYFGRNAMWFEGEGFSGGNIREFVQKVRERRK